MRNIAAAALLLSAIAGFAADYPAPVEKDFVVRDFHFASGETLAGATDFAGGKGRHGAFE